MLRVNPHLPFNGDCETAFRFYETTLGAKVTFLMTYGNSPMADSTKPGWQGKILHASLLLGGETLTGADAPPDQYRPQQGIALLLSADTVEEAERIFTALSSGGAVQMPIQETFWALRFGMLVDRFGIPWMINCSKPM